MKIGYARVSTDEQNLNLQLDALHAVGCEEIFQDAGISGARTKRPGLDRAMRTLSEGDTLVVWRLDRLGRSMQHLVSIIHEFGEKCIGFQSLSESIDTTTASGELYFHLMSALAQFERRLTAERCKAGMEAA